MSIASLSFTLFLLMDPIGNIPIYLSVLKEIEPKRQRKIILRELLIALGVVFLFVFLGNTILKFLGISQHTVFIAGGIILFIIAIRLIFPQPSIEDKAQGEPFIVPLAVPLVAGPAVMAAIVIYSSQCEKVILISAVSIAWIVTTLILISASLLNKILGKRGVIACERLMGLILTLLAVQMFLTGIESFLYPNHDTAKSQAHARL